MQFYTKQESPSPPAGEPSGRKSPTVSDVVETQPFAPALTWKKSGLKDLAKTVRWNKNLLAWMDVDVEINNWVWTCLSVFVMCEGETRTTLTKQQREAIGVKGQLEYILEVSVPDQIRDQIGIEVIWFIRHRVGEYSVVV